MIFSSALSAATADSAYLVHECIMKTDSVKWRNIDENKRPRY